MSKPFKKYCIYVAAYFSVFIALVLECELKVLGMFKMHVGVILFSSFSLASTISAVFLALTAQNVFQISRKSNLSSHNEFEAEKQR